MKTHAILDQLRRYESRNVTFIDPDGSWPIVWDSAKGVQVRNADGRLYLDLTAAFGVAATGHANPRVVRAGRAQMTRLLHAMGDVHPHPLKAKLACELSRITFERWNATQRGRTIFCNSGFEAVEAALKTALLATGKPGVIAFSGGYHGLGYGALNVTHRAFFRAPFQAQLRRFARFVPFAVTDGDLEKTEKQVEALLRRGQFGAVLVEPIQARGGIRVPHPRLLRTLRKLCNEFQALLIADEIYTGFGRTGRWFACEQEGVVPDLICLGKALTGGFPLSACVGKAQIMDAWPPSKGEALHTSTFLGHPVGCAMALAQIAELESRPLVERSAELGEFLLNSLRSITPPANLKFNVRGRGLLVGMEVRSRDGLPATAFVIRAMKRMLTQGFILLPEGEHSEVISFTPPLIITRAQLTRAVTALKAVLAS